METRLFKARRCAASDLARYLRHPTLLYSPYRTLVYCLKHRVISVCYAFTDLGSGGEVVMINR